MHVRMIAVGDELLDGRLVESNSTRFAQRLRPFGLKLRHKEAVGDDLPEIKEALSRAAQTDAALVLVCGGLGITNDDLTRLALSQWLDSPLIEDPPSVAVISERVTSRGYTMSDDLRRHGQLPACAKPLSNPLGLAIGILTHASANAPKRPLIMVLPGVVEEFEAMLDAHLPEILQSLTRANSVWRQRRFGFVGLSERVLEQSLPTAAWSPSIRVALNVNNGFVEVALSTSDATEALAEDTLAQAESALRCSPVASNLMTFGGDSVPKTILDLLAARAQTLCVAESCTGGLISSALTDVPGSSAVFREGFITYANDAKTSRLGVDPQTLITYGAVSRHTVTEMALGARDRSPAHYALAVSGIAGPGGAVAGKPVGLVHVAVAGPHPSPAHHAFFFPGRERRLVKQLTLHNALAFLLCVIQGRPFPAPPLPPSVVID